MVGNSKSAQNSVASEAEITLGMLNAVEQSSAVTQRSLARELNIALGLANAYLKRCAKKGFIKIRQVPRNRYAYYLTPEGFSEKSRLTREYLSQSLNFFRAARNQCNELLGQCVAAGWRRVALAGVGDMAEIATLCAHDHEVELVGIIEYGDFSEPAFAGLPVVRSAESLDRIDIVIVTDTIEPQKVFDTLSESFPADRLLTPAVLHVSRVRPRFSSE